MHAPGSTVRGVTIGLSVGDAARAAGVSIDTLRYYEREQLMRIDRTTSGHRRYSPGDLEWIAVLTCLRDTGMPIRRMREFAAMVGENDDATIGARITLLESHRADVKNRIRELHRNLAHVEGKIAYYRGRQTTSAQPVEVGTDTTA